MAIIEKLLKETELPPKELLKIESDPEPKQAKLEGLEQVIHQFTQVK